MTELPNLFPDMQEQTYEYESLPDGKHVMALTKIKLDEQRKVKRVNGQIIKTDELEPVYNFVFRSYENPSAFVNRKVKPSLDQRSNMFKLLRNMTDYAVTKETSTEQAYDMMCKLVGKWFEVRIVNNPYTYPDGKTTTFTNIVDGNVTPISDETLPTPDKHFGTVKGDDPVGVGAFEGYEDGSLTLDEKMDKAMGDDDISDDDLDQMPF